MSQTRWNTSLQSSLAGATRLRVRSVVQRRQQTEPEKPLLDLADIRQIQTLIQGIQINEDESGFRCMCSGNPWLEFFKESDLIASIGFHHGVSLRWNDGSWPGDGLLKPESSKFLIEWMAEHGVTGPRDEVEVSRKRGIESRDAYSRWTAAIPPILLPVWDQAIRENEWTVGEKLSPALYESFPDTTTRILALLNWFGSGAGPWSGFPSYEQVVEKILVNHRTSDVLLAIHGVELTSPLIEGVARYFGGWSFNKDRAEDKKLLPADLKKRLLEHVLKSDDEDKKHRARKAFGA